MAPARDFCCWIDLLRQLSLDIVDCHFERVDPDDLFEQVQDVLYARVGLGLCLRIGPATFTTLPNDNLGMSFSCMLLFLHLFEELAASVRA